MPVMTRHMKIERLSTSMLKGTSSEPLLIHVQYVKSPEALLKKSASVPANEAHTTPGPTICVKSLGRRQRRPAIRIAPAAGRMRTASASWLVLMGFSSLQLAELVDVLDIAHVEDVDQDRETDHRLSRRDRHRHEREQLSLDVLELSRENDQREVDRVEHQLDADEDDQRVAADQHACRADREEDRAEDQEPGGVELRSTDGHPAHLRGPREKSPRTRSLRLEFAGTPSTAKPPISWGIHMSSPCLRLR